MNVYISILSLAVYFSSIYVLSISTNKNNKNTIKILIISSFIVLKIAFLILGEKEAISSINYIVDMISVYTIYKVSRYSLVLDNKEVVSIQKRIENNKDQIEKIKSKINTELNISNKIRESSIKKQELIALIQGQNNRCTFIIDTNGYILNEDVSFFKMWNIDSKLKLNINIVEFANDNIKKSDDFINCIDNVLLKGIEIRTEEKSKDGRILECILAPFNINEEAIGIICAMNDITYRKNSEMKIAENDEKYKKIVDNIPYSVLIADEEQIIYNNNKSKSIDFSQRKMKSIVLNKDINGELVCKSVYGDKVYLDIDKINLDDEDSSKHIVAIKDITEYIQLMKELENSKDKYESLVNIIPEGIYISEYEDNKIEYYNNAYKNIVGKNSIIQNDDKHRLINSEAVEFKRNIINSVYDETHIEHGEMLIQVNDKLKRIGIVRDITQQVKYEEIEREVEAKKKENELKTEFFINMSHELKTPINVITSSNQLLEIMNKSFIENNPNSDISNCIAITKKHTYMLMGLINNIIDLAKIESKFYESNKDYYNIVNIVEDICEEFGKHVKMNGIDILFDTDEEEQVAKLDPNDIEKIILTLLSMIIRYSYKDSIIDVNLSSDIGKLTIKMQNDKYNYNKYISDKERRNIDIGITVAKSMLKLYDGKIDIKVDCNSSMEIIVEFEINDSILDYKTRVIAGHDSPIYNEYIRLCDF